jgi:hypothetical protein
MPLDANLRASLATLLDESEPLGPIDQGEISRLSDARAILFEDTPAFSTALSKDATLIIGRKGAGKSSVLAEYKIAAATPPKEARVIEIVTWKHFFEMVKSVGELLPHDADPSAVLTPPEYVAQLWERVIWDEIIKHYYNECLEIDKDEVLAPVCNYINPSAVADSKLSDSDLANDLYQKSIDAILKFTTHSGERCLVLFDNMDDFPVRNPLFRKVTAGLLKCINAFNRKNRGVTLVFCLPEEVEFAFSETSSNIIKDYQKAHRIHWKPIDLLRITAHRYRLLMGIKDELFYEEIEELDFDRREDIHKLFDRLLPSEVENALGQTEDPLAYIIRHSQLLPRHIIFFFNEVLRRTYRATGGFRQLESKSVVEGVKEVEKTVALHVLTPYQTMYPRLISACKDILPDLEPVCTASDLDKVARRFKNLVEDDVISVWHKLFEMGILGKVIPTNDNPPEFIKSSRYVLGAFHYNIDGSFSVATDGQYCFHPIFSSFFGISRRDPNDKRTVYPANVDDVTLSGLVVRR